MYSSDWHRSFARLQSKLESEGSFTRWKNSMSRITPKIACSILLLLVFVGDFSAETAS